MQMGYAMRVSRGMGLMRSRMNAPFAKIIHMVIMVLNVSISIIATMESQERRKNYVWLAKEDLRSF